MYDIYQRKIDYLRISITDQCYYQCSYCKSDSSPSLLHQDFLTYEQILNIAKAAIKVGITKFKITGGEPTQRKNYLCLLASLKKLKGIESLTLTTNGSLFTKSDLDFLKEIDIDGINFSLDTIDENEYFLLTKQRCLKIVLENLLYAYRLGIRIKINCVVDETFHLNRFLSLLEFIKERDITLRFINIMPLNKNNACNQYNDLLHYIRHHYSYQKTNVHLGNGPANYIKISGYQGYVGFIDALNHKFCHECNRLRLTSHGQLKPCLYFCECIDLKDVINNEDLLIYRLQKIIKNKPKEHHFDQKMSLTKMNEVGG